MKFQTAYLKLTVFYVLIAMAISIAFSIAIYNISSKELGRGLGRQTDLLLNIQMGRITLGQTPDLDKMRHDQLEESNDRLKINLIYFNLLILFLSSAASYFLARKTLEPIKEAMDAQNRFTADASHELRTPLTAMRTEIEVGLRDKKFNLEEAKKLLQSNLEETEKLESLSNALLKLARFEDDSRASFSKVSIEDVLVEAYEKIECLANKKSIKINCHPEPMPTGRQVDSGSNIFIRGDRQSLVELFVILLDNAIKYSPEKSKVLVHIRKEKNDVVVSVRDYGIGIKASDLPHIFNRFYRADTSRSKEKIDGYGLGLSIAKRIADFHGGDISVTSKPGKGSVFVVKL